MIDLAPWGMLSLAFYPTGEPDSWIKGSFDTRSRCDGSRSHAQSPGTLAWARTFRCLSEYDAGLLMMMCAARGCQTLSPISFGPRIVRKTNISGRHILRLAGSIRRSGRCLATIPGPRCFAHEESISRQLKDDEGMYPRSPSPGRPSAESHASRKSANVVTPLA